MSYTEEARGAQLICHLENRKGNVFMVLPWFIKWKYAVCNPISLFEKQTLLLVLVLLIKIRFWDLENLKARPHKESIIISAWKLAYCLFPQLIWVFLHCTLVMISFSSMKSRYKSQFLRGPSINSSPNQVLWKSSLFSLFSVSAF